MKPCLRFFLGASLALFGAAAAHAQLSPTGISASPGSALPGDTVTFTITVSNAGAANFIGTSDFSILLTNLSTGATFTVAQAGVSPTGGFIAAATIAAPPAAAAPGVGTFTVTGVVPPQVTQAGNYRAVVTMSAITGQGAATPSFGVSASVLTITGTPDLEITSLTYNASTSYQGGNVIPMQITFRNNSGSNNNVPFVPSSTSYFRIQIVLSSNPTFGDADDFQLTFFDVGGSGSPFPLTALTGNGGSSVLNADGADRTITWNQLLPGNFSGSYYVLAKIDSLNAVSETVENNIWHDVAGTRIALQPTTFPTIYLASTTTDATSGSGYSDNPSLTADGRYTAFASDASNLVVGDTNRVRDIFIYDAQTSLVRRVSLSQQGAQPNGNSNNPSLSGNGRYVAFSSDATNLILGDVNGFTDIFVVDTLTGAISLQSISTAGVQANGSNFRPSVSHTGRYIVFESSATNLIAAGTTPGATHIYLRDRLVSGSGVFDIAGNTSTTIIDVTGATVGNASAVQAQISADGNYVVFASKATNLAAAATTLGRQHIYLRDRAGATTTLVDGGTGGLETDKDSRNPSINRNTGVAAGTFADGRYVAFASDATVNLIAADTNGVSDIFVYDRVAATTTRVSVSSAGAEGVDPTNVLVTGSYLGSINPSISATGRYVTFASLDNNLAPGDNVGRYNAAGSGNGALNIYVMDRDKAGTSTSAVSTFDPAGLANIQTTDVSVNRFGYQAYYILNVESTAAADIFPVISADGRWVAFPTDSESAPGLFHTTTNQLSPDNNGARDVALFDRRTNSLPSPATPPTVTITSPGASPVLVNTVIPITASATTNLGVVSSVQFFVNGTSLGTSTVFPYTQSWTPTAVGTYTLSALVTDSFGNIGVSPNVTVTVNAAPSVGITGISPGPANAIIVSTAQTITATAGASNPGATITGVQFFANGSPLPASVLAAGVWTTTWTPATTGSFTLTAKATDNVGTQQTSPGFAVVVVTVGGGGGGGAAPPTVQLTSTAPTTSASPVNVPITLTATAAASNGFSVTSVAFYQNGTLIPTTVAHPNPATTAPYTVVVTPTVAGAYTFTAVATDSSSATGTTTPVIVNVAGVAPTVAFGLTVPATLPVNIPQILTANPTPAAGFTIAQVEYFANGVSLGTANAFPYRFTWTPTSMGTYVITAVASDNVGSRSLPVTATVVVDSGTVPTIPFTSPIDGASYAVGNPITVSATAALGSGLFKGVEFFANGVSIGTASALPFSVTFTPIAAGTYVFTAIGTDTSGNTVAATPVSVTVVGATAPTVAIASPANNVSVPVNVPQTVTVTAGSSSASLTSVDVTVNGVSLGAKTTFPYVFAWTPASEGSYVFIAVATDSQGAKSTSIPITVKVVAAAPPTVSIATPFNGSSFPVGNPISFRANASTSAPGLTIASVQFFANGVSLGTKTTSPYTLTWTPVVAGHYSLTAVATDTSGATATSTSAVTVTIGLNASPTIALTSPSAPATYALGSGVLLSAAAADSDGTVSSVQFSANGLLLTTVTTAPYTFSWVPQASGTYQITASATDNSGNVTTTAQLPVTISAAVTTTVSTTNPVAGGSYPVGNAIPFAASVVGGNGPITQVQFFVNGASIGTKTSSPYVVQWTPLAPGTYSLLAVATDSAGISTNSLARTITITANAPPTVTLTSPASGSSANAGAIVSLAASFSDLDGTVTSVVFLANGNVITTVSPPSGSLGVSGTWIPTAAGAYSVVAQATDNSGNVTNSTPSTVNVFPNQPPTVSLTSPVSGSTVRVGGSITLTSNAGDVDGTVASVQFFANGVLIGTDTTPPYTAQWAPTADGIYRLVAVAIDNSGAVTTSATVLAIASTGAGDSSVTAGSYQGPGEVGNYAVITAVGKTAVFIAYSTTPGIDKTYFYPGIPVDVSGGFNLNDASGVTLISGSVNVTGTSATFDAGRLQFIGIDTIYLAGAVTVPARYYTGSLTGHAASALSAIVGSDGSIMLYVADGSFTDAGGGGLGGKINSTGAFSVTTVRGNRFTGKVDPSTGALTGTLSGTNGGAFTGAPAILGVSTSAKVSGAGRVVQADIVAPNGNTYDQVLLQGATATITADPGKITRVSYVDLTNDIVQIEFSGAGALSIALENSSGPATAVNYNQPDIAYMKGHAGIMISGANESTNVSVFSVGRITAVNQALFKNNVAYDGVADIAYLVITSLDGKFGGIRTANASYLATQGIAGVCAPGIQFSGPVYVGDISAADTASPMLLLGSASDVRITGGNLFQTNGQAVQVSGLTQLKFVSGVTSQGATLPAQTDRSRLEENGADVTARVVVNPGP